MIESLGRITCATYPHSLTSKQGFLFSSLTFSAAMQQAITHGASMLLRYGDRSLQDTLREYSGSSLWWDTCVDVV